MKEETYIAYLENQSVLQADRIAELEAALSIALNNIDRALMVGEIKPDQMQRVIEVMNRARPLSDLMKRKFRSYYAEAEKT